MIRLGFLIVCLACVPAIAAVPLEDLSTQWPTALGNSGGARYSPLGDIHRGNVTRLAVAWTYRHGDVRSGWPVRDLQGTVFEATPILVGRRLVFPTPFNRVIALDPESGRERWTFDPGLDRSRYFPNKMVSRGVASWTDVSGNGSCSVRVFLATLDARLIALDAETGRRCPGFGLDGTVDLTAGIQGIVDTWEYQVTSPPTVVGDLVVVGSSIADMIRRVQPSGAVRAFDARTGRLVWRFDPVPNAGDPAARTWEGGSHARHGGANVWSTMTADPLRGLVFLPVSTAGPDHYGGDRPGANLYTDSIVALDAATGALRWHFQTVHHDLWDYDLAAPPLLATVFHGGRPVDAVVQLTKTGLVFVLHRETGAPLFRVEERPVPASDIPGEHTWPTQPFPTRPPPLMAHRLTEHDLWRDDPARFRKCHRKLASLRNEGIFTPPSTRGTLLFPGPVGGVNWFGGAFDPEARTLFVPVNHVGIVSYLDPLPPENYANTDGIVLQSPLRALRWLWQGTGTGLRYHMIRREYFAVEGVFCNAPPWSTLAAVDLDDGEIRWTVPIGSPEHGVAGALAFAPPLVTGGGLIFAGGSADMKLHVFDTRNGSRLATLQLPAGQHAGPMTYRAGGQQYLVVAAGGHAVQPTPLGDWIVAFRLQRNGAPRERTSEAMGIPPPPQRASAASGRLSMNTAPPPGRFAAVSAPPWRSTMQ